MCDCNGSGSKRRALTVSVNGTTASVAREAIPGMPRYKVTGSAQGDAEFSTYNDARIFRARHGGKLRTVS